MLECDELHKELVFVTVIKQGRIRWAGHVQNNKRGKGSEKSVHRRTRRKKSKRKAKKKMDGRWR